ncbi:MAG: carboxypeptidase regulatory-like domain-containing protein [Bryobacteraceae bacterium]|nr:carboxypeptidase regulatory-like domain-containing protein [Bryobacteraceae bacterium]
MRAATILLALSLLGAHAQSPQASISGTVRDPNGAPMAGVAIAATNPDNGLNATATTNDSGFYSLQSLAIGPYVVRVELAGFQAQVQKGLVLTTGEALELNFTLKVGAVTETIAVTADAPLLDTRSSGASQLIEAKTVEDIPLGDRRALNVMELQGGAVFVSYESGQRPYFSVGGGRGRSQNFIMDGGNAQTIRIGQAQVELDPPVETLQEVRVLSNGFSAEYGGTASGVIVMNTKSGTNRRHGSLFEYFRNEKLDAANFFSPWVNNQKVRAPIRYNVFGGTFGGPIRRDKIFYFGGYEGSRRRDGRAVVMTVPSLLEGAGDFSRTFNPNGSLATIYDPSSGPPTARTAFAGNRIPASRLDPVALNVIKAYPLPNRAPDNIAGSNNFRANTVDLLDRDNVTAKLDYNLSVSHRLGARYLWNRQDSSVRSVYADPGAEPTGSNANNGSNLLASWTAILRPTVINEFRFGLVDRTTFAFTQGLGKNYPTKLGLIGIADDAFPRFNVTGYTPLGSNNQRRDQTPIRQTQFSNVTSWIRGTHSVRFGGETRRSRNKDFRLAQVSGAFTFNRATTGIMGQAATGNALAALIVGTPTAFSASNQPVIDRSSRYWAAFIQDDWQIHRDLVLNLGLRWEADTPFKTRNNIMNSFDANAINPVSGTRGVVRFAGVGGYPDTPHDFDLNNFGPRIGLAWKPFGNSKTVVRTAFGILFAGPYDASDATGAVAIGFGDALVIPTGQDGTPIPYRLSERIPVQSIRGTLDDRFGAVPVGTAPNTAVSFFERRRPTGYSQQINFTMQRELGASTTGEVAYLGNLSRKMPGNPLSINQVPTALLTPGNNQSRRPFPQFSDVMRQGPNTGTINYHALVAKAQKRFSSGMNLLATYTYAKSLDNTTNIAALGSEGSEYSNAYNRRADYGFSENDIRHRIAASSIYQLPYGRGRRFGKRGRASTVLGNWSVASVVVWQTGAPFTVRTATNTTQAFSAGPLRADVLANPNLVPARRSLTRWFDTDAFRQPAVNQFGNQGVNILRAAGRISLNTSLLRDITLREGLKLQFRGEAFNVFNHANFGLPGQILGNADFGVIGAAAAPRQLQLGMRCVF